MLDLICLFHGIKSYFSTEKDGSRKGDSILFHSSSVICICRRKQSDGDGNSGSSYQCTEPGWNEDFTTRADLDLHMSLLDHHVSPLPAKVTESLYDKVKMECVCYFQSMSLEGKSSTELVSVASDKCFTTFHGMPSS